ncbi:MAG TPA: SHOCT domain-containing protein [Opitutaceae bacterium]|nr:SHOCT domain-containing protein [Opitutaceae bacterium]
MNIADELQKLADLRRDGNLTDGEFADAKRRLLAQQREEGAGSPPSNEAGGSAPANPIEEMTYRSSRWSTGNTFFPDSLTLATDGILFRKGRLFGSSEERINYKAIASLRVKNGIFLSNISVETSGGSQPIYINGLWKSDARKIQDGIRSFQRGA